MTRIERALVHWKGDVANHKPSKASRRTLVWEVAKDVDYGTKRATARNNTKSETPMPLFEVRT